jgi:hypothetical protein
VLVIVLLLFEGDCCRFVWNDNYSTPTIAVFIERDIEYSELRS